MNGRSDLTFNAEEILMIIQDELMTIMENNSYNQMGYDVKIALERQFIRKKELNPKTIYVVVKFGEADLNYGQLVAPFTITAVSEENDIEIGYHLLLEFSEKYNLKMSDDGTILQAYTSPTLSNSFQYIVAGYRPILYMSGTFLISKNVNRLSFKYVEYKINNEFVQIDDVNIVKLFDRLYQEFGQKDSFKFYIDVDDNLLEVWNDDDKEWVTLPKVYYDYIKYSGTSTSFEFTINIKQSSLNALTRILNMNIDLDTQGFYSTNNYTKSEAKLGTLSFNVSSNLLSDNDFCNKCLDILSKRNGINNSFIMRINFSNSGHTFYDVFKAMTINIQENAAALPLLTVALTN